MLAHFFLSTGICGRAGHLHYGGGRTGALDIAG